MSLLVVLQTFAAHRGAAPWAAAGVLSPGFAPCQLLLCACRRLLVLWLASVVEACVCSQGVVAVGFPTCRFMHMQLHCSFGRCGHTLQHLLCACSSEAYIGCTTRKSDKRAKHQF